MIFAHDLWGEKKSFGAFARMKSLNSVLSIYGYDLELIIFQVILFRCLKTIFFFYKNENSTLFKSSNLYFQYDPSVSQGPVYCAFLCIVSLGMSYLATSTMLLLSILAYSCVVS